MTTTTLNDVPANVQKLALAYLDLNGPAQLSMYLQKNGWMQIAFLQFALRRGMKFSDIASALRWLAEHFSQPDYLHQTSHFSGNSVPSDELVAEARKLLEDAAANLEIP